MEHQLQTRSIIRGSINATPGPTSEGAKNSVTKMFYD